MTCDPKLLKDIPLFSLLDDDEAAVLAAQVEHKEFAPRERIYKKGDPGGQAYVVVSGKVRVTTVDEDQQEVVVDEPAAGDFLDSPRCWSNPRTTPRRLPWNRLRVWKFRATTS